jgi:hypothetical protein
MKPDKQWAMKWVILNGHPVDNPEYTSLIKQGYHPVREMVHHGWIWVLMEKEIMT